MNRYAKSGLVLMLIAVHGLCGCSPRGRLARQIAKADCVVLTNAYQGFSISVTGSEVKRIVRAVSSASKLPPNTTSSVEFRTEFYRGTNLLGAVVGCSSGFGVEGTGYDDNSGALQALYERYQGQHFNPVLHGR
jgi:hypothetical protein